MIPTQRKNSCREGPMGEVIRFPRARRHARASSYKSGRSSCGAMPVNLEIGSTRSAGTRPSSQRSTVDLLTPNSAANASSVIPAFSRNERMVRSDMEAWLHNTQLSVKPKVASGANDRPPAPALLLRMGRPKKILDERPHQRFHYIAEWAEKRQKQQADLVRDLNVNKGTVSRWFSGTIPTDQYLVILAAYFELDAPADLFRDPDDDWMARLLRGRSEDEIKRIRDMIDLAFPRKHRAA